MYYTNYGPVRGSCGHAHKDIIAARACIERDRRACERERRNGASGYSDREMWEVASRSDITAPAQRNTSRMIESSEWRRYY